MDWNTDIPPRVYVPAFVVGAFLLLRALVAIPSPPPTTEYLAAQQQQAEQQQTLAARQKRAAQDQWEQDMASRQYPSHEDMDNSIRIQNYYDGRMRCTETSAHPDNC